MIKNKKDVDNSIADMGNINTKPGKKYLENYFTVVTKKIKNRKNNHSKPAERCCPRVHWKIINAKG